MKPDTDITATDDTPWYRQFWPWFIMAFPATSVVAGLLTFYLAGAEPSMVVDDYGRIAMATRQRAEREQHAAEIGLSAKIDFHGVPVQNPGLAARGNGQSVTVTLSRASADDPWPARVQLKLVHPTLSERDADAILQGAGGRYVGTIERARERYYLSLSDLEGTWRLTGESWGHKDSLELNAAERASAP
jgi:hypothetical protein